MMNGWKYLLLLSMLSGTSHAAQPNIILLMADDLGYGDTGLNGYKIIQTPNLDALSKNGTVLTHFFPTITHIVDYQLPDARPLDA